jgi:hypothetical protein
MFTRPFLMLVCLVILGPVGSAPASQEDLVLYWPFNEGQGTVARDRSGNGNDGVIEGGALWVPGALGTALQFNGSDALVRGPHIPFNSRSFTHALWVNPSLLAGDQSVFSQYGLLDFETTYYWRIDEVNAAPTTRSSRATSGASPPSRSPIRSRTSSPPATGSRRGAGPEKTVDGSGLDADDQHSTTAPTCGWPAPAMNPVHPVRVRPRLQAPRDARLELQRPVRADARLRAQGRHRRVLRRRRGLDRAGRRAVRQATARATYAANTGRFQGVAARYVRLTVNSGWGMMGQYGLSEVRFLYIPAQAREPQPADGAPMSAWTAR